MCPRLKTTKRRSPRRVRLFIAKLYNQSASFLQLFNLIETYNYHHSTPSAGTNVFSFALHPEQHQPSGTCNLSRIDNTLINLKLYFDTPYPDPSRNPPPLSIVSNTSECHVYCTNYNVLRVMSGMGGLAYSN